MEGGHALADVLLGRVNPSGKLPCVFLRSESDLPYFDNNAEEIEYGLFHGYRRLEKDYAEPAFPFGFGLSFTSLVYIGLSLEASAIERDGTLRTSVEVTKAGPRPGEE